MAKDRTGQEIKKGDTVGVLFTVIEAQPTNGPGTNLVLRASHVPEGEHVPCDIHINSGAVTLVDADDVPKAQPATEKLPPLTTGGDKPKPAA